jgi:hypothetical protein
LAQLPSSTLFFTSFLNIGEGAPQDGSALDFDGSGCPSIRPSAVQPDAEHARGKRMTTYVYDYPIGSTASFYIDGDYVYPMSGTQPAFWINGEYWYPNPPTGTPAFSVSGKYVYEHPASSKPRYYLG